MSEPYEIPHPLTLEWLAQFGSLSFVSHINEGTAHHYTYEAHIKGTRQSLLGIYKAKSSYTRAPRNKEKAGRVFIAWGATGFEETFATLAELVAAINKREDRRRADEEFDAAAPKQGSAENGE